MDAVRTNHTRAILPLMRALSVTGPDLSIAVRRRRTAYRTTYLAEVTEWEMDGYGQRRSAVRVFTLVLWCPTTGELFVDDGDRISGGVWDTYRNTARANKDALDAVAAYAVSHGHPIAVHHDLPPVTRDRHYRITA